MNDVSTPDTHCGFIAIIGRPNVGKSTLLNYILDRKISITANKPQTTRHRILGIKTVDKAQLIFMDTPGLHRKEVKALNKTLNRTVLETIPEADMVLFIIEGGRFDDEDKWIAERLLKFNKPLIIGLNKSDIIKDKNKMLPYLQELQQQFPDVPLIPISALSGDNVPRLMHVIAEQLPNDYFYFDNDQITDRSDRFLAAELIREKLMRFLGQEVPYSTAVMIEQFEKEDKLLRIAATIFVERDSQKSIVIGNKGERLKQIGSAARQNMQRLFGEKVFLSLWVKVKTGWSDDQRALKSLGYDEQT